MKTVAKKRPTDKLTASEVSAALTEMAHNLAGPFEPKLEVLEPELLELTQWVATRDAYTPNMIELRRRAELVLAMHEIATQRAKRGVS